MMDFLKSLAPIFGACITGGICWLVIRSEGVESALVFIAGFIGWGIMNSALQFDRLSNQISRLESKIDNL